MAKKHQVLELVREHPGLSAVEMAARLGCMPEYIRATLSRKRAADAKAGLPVVRKVPPSKWSEQDLALLVQKRQSGQRWKQIAEEMKRPLPSCFDRYSKIVRSQRMETSIVHESPVNLPFHQQLGIKTYVHLQAMACDPRGRAFMPVTLARIFA